MWSKFILPVWHGTPKLRIYHNLVKDHWNPTGSSTSKYKPSQQESFHNPGHIEFHEPNTSDEEELTVKNRQTSWIKHHTSESGDTIDRNSYGLLAGVSNAKTTLELNLWIPGTSGDKQTLQSASSGLGICPRIFTALLFLKSNYDDNQKSQSEWGWISKVWFIHTLEYYQIIKMNEHIQVYKS
jgi:hypothetical protein